MYSEFACIPQLAVPDADMMIVFLSPEGTLFLNPTYDPWYHATNPMGAVGSSDKDQRVLYAPNEAASPMGCVQRYQWCNSNKGCGSLASYTDSLASLGSLFHQDTGQSMGEEDATSQRFTMFANAMSSSFGVADLLNVLGSSSLLSPQHSAQGLMGPLPDNQWQLDINYWFAIHMAAMQAAFVSTARGLTDKALLPFFASPDIEHQQAMQAMCNNQVSNGLVHLSFAARKDALRGLLIHVYLVQENP